MQTLIDQIQPLNAQALKSALERQDQLTKPPKSLGKLEALGVRLAGILGTEKPEIQNPVAIVCAGDHGVCEEGVSAFPASVTPLMVLNFLAEGAAVNAIARTVGAKVQVINAGVNADLPDHPALVNTPVRRGTRNLRKESALTREEAEKALLLGAEVATQAIQQGAGILVPGEMGIGNTTPAAAITARMLNLSPDLVTGRGTGISDEGLTHKVQVIKEALNRNQSHAEDPLGVLADLGGLEIAAMTGVMLAGAAHRVPVVIDGFIAGSAALIAAALSPLSRDYFFASHQSVEIGHVKQLSHLGLEPLLNLDMRLGEGTGGVLCVPILQAAASVLKNMATFAEAGIG
ncbi:nicotinate-nucleotide--dimethylbenzimidazole phosphoribosyltransferase [Deinococcus cellulosilyticus]|uniref:Nicotinate-nucleotide--dimethylbenzimidazole phosphoribosyltransferase n=1 Tax=Deinococcus cellulosilyticus (strain DSM 18568 / NBRC 106333 / KACC 11606 / 5516J-15) TaxID=1223518 RepID=A0A511N9J4_DEIC1|nr:nicotinate-nucleotide--dimethylbenzimidazole phosphoribosyltransferase [Deinococcus cellulosilyticus]GEM49505.1 nicotinate-nucleotide--dimethylbenzimidazole phosphoribosyltransferase [Deinococcus cellulosilyticus NBRC 106333 = KACC 11606]